MENIFIIKPTSKSPVDEILALIKVPVDKGPLFLMVSRTLFSRLKRILIDTRSSIQPTKTRMIERDSAIIKVRNETTFGWFFVFLFPQIPSLTLTLCCVVKSNGGISFFDGFITKIRTGYSPHCREQQSPLQLF